MVPGPPQVSMWASAADLVLTSRGTLDRERTTVELLGKGEKEVMFSFCCGLLGSQGKP